MKKEMLKKIIPLPLCLLFFLGAVMPAFAATHIVTPLAVNFDLQKRDIASDTITVINTSERKIRIYATVNEVATDGDGVVKGFVQKVEADRTNTPTAWIEISRKRMELAPDEKLEIPFTVRMNPEVEPGEYNVFIGIAEASNRTQAAEKVSAGNAPGTIVHISVDQKQNQFLRLENFSIDKFVSDSKEETLSFTLSNPGGSDVIPAGEIIFYDNSGNEVNALPLNTEKKVVPADGEEEFVMDIPEELRLGKYKAFLSVEYGKYLTASVHDTAFFYVLPWKLLLLLFVTVLLITVLVTLFIQRRYNSEEGDDGSGSVALFIKEGISDRKDHDIDLSKKHEEDSV